MLRCIKTIRSLIESSIYRNGNTALTGRSRQFSAVSRRGQSNLLTLIRRKRSLAQRRKAAKEIAAKPKHGGKPKGHQNEIREEGIASRFPLFFLAALRLGARIIFGLGLTSNVVSLRRNGRVGRARPTGAISQRPTPDVGWALPTRVRLRSRQRAGALWCNLASARRSTGRARSGTRPIASTVIMRRPRLE